MKYIIALLLSILITACNKSNIQYDTLLQENLNLKQENLQQRNKIDSLARLLIKVIPNSDIEKIDKQNIPDDPNTSLENKTVQNDEEIIGEVKIKELIERQKPSFDMIHASVLDFVGKKMTLYGYVKVSNLFFDKYSGLEKNYYCINMLDNNIMAGGHIFVYFAKKENKELFEIVGMNQHHTPMKIEGIMKKNMIDYDSPTPVFEGLNWKVLK